MKFDSNTRLSSELAGEGQLLTHPVQICDLHYLI